MADEKISYVDFIKAACDPNRVSTLEAELDAEIELAERRGLDVAYLRLAKEYLQAARAYNDGNPIGYLLPPSFAKALCLAPDPIPAGPDVGWRAHVSFVRYIRDRPGQGSLTTFLFPDLALAPNCMQYNLDTVTLVLTSLTQLRSLSVMSCKAAMASPVPSKKLKLERCDGRSTEIHGYRVPQGGAVAVGAQVVDRMGPITFIGQAMTSCGGEVAVYHTTAWRGPRGYRDGVLSRLLPALNAYLRYCLTHPTGISTLGAAGVQWSNGDPDPTANCCWAQSTKSTTAAASPCSRRRSFSSLTGCGGAAM